MVNTRGQNKNRYLQEDLSLFNTGSRYALTSLIYSNNLHNSIATFDLYIRELPQTRNYFVAMGLEEVVDYVKYLKFNTKQIAWLKKSFKLSPDIIKYYKDFKFTGDIWAIPDGRIFFPNEPIIRVTAPIIEASFLEHFLINNAFTHISLASKFSRFQDAAGDTPTLVGYNRCYGIDTALRADSIKAIFGIGGNSALYNFKTGCSPFSIGTYHYLIMLFNNELEAFRAYMKYTNGEGLILVDTYDSEVGIRNFITAAKEVEQFGGKAKGIQLDSGNLLSLSNKARKMLDDAGLHYVKIQAMSNLDEWKLAELRKQKAPIDIYAGTTELLTPRDAPILEVVYKLSEIKKGNKVFPKMKTASQKLSLPGRKQVFRLKKDGVYVKDVIGLEHEKISNDRLLVPIFKNGNLVKNLPSDKETRELYLAEKEKFDPALFDVNIKYNYAVAVSEDLQKLAQKTREEITRTHYADVT